MSAEVSASAAIKQNIQKLKNHLKSRETKVEVDSKEKKSAKQVMEDGRFYAYVEDDQVIISDKAKKAGDTQVDLTDNGLDQAERAALGMNEDIYDIAAQGLKKDDELEGDVKGSDVLSFEDGEFEELTSLVDRFAETFGYTKAQAWEKYLNAENFTRIKFKNAEQTSEAYQEQYKAYSPKEGQKTYSGFLQKDKGVAEDSPVLEELPEEATGKEGTQHVLRYTFEHGKESFDEASVDSYLASLNPLITEEDYGKVKKLSAMGKTALDAKDYKKALSYFQKAYDTVPNAGYLLTIANTQYKLNEIGAVKETFKKFDKIYPNYTSNELTALKSKVGLGEEEVFEEAVQTEGSLKSEGEENKYTQQVHDKTLKVLSTAFKKNKDLRLRIGPYEIRWEEGNFTTYYNDKSYERGLNLSQEAAVKGILSWAVGSSEEKLDSYSAALKKVKQKANKLGSGKVVDLKTMAEENTGKKFAYVLQKEANHGEIFRSLDDGPGETLESPAKLSAAKPKKDVKFKKTALKLRNFLTQNPELRVTIEDSEGNLYGMLATIDGKILISKYDDENWGPSGCSTLNDVLYATLGEDKAKDYRVVQALPGLDVPEGMTEIDLNELFESALVQSKKGKVQKKKVDIKKALAWSLYKKGDDANNLENYEGALVYFKLANETLLNKDCQTKIAETERRIGGEVVADKQPTPTPAPTPPAPAPIPQPIPQPMPQPNIATYDFKFDDLLSNDKSAGRESKRSTLITYKKSETEKELPKGTITKESAPTTLEPEKKGPTAEKLAAQEAKKEKEAEITSVKQECDAAKEMAKKLELFGKNDEAQTLRKAADRVLKKIETGKKYQKAKNTFENEFGKAQSLLVQLSSLPAATYLPDDQVWAEFLRAGGVNIPQGTSLDTYLKKGGIKEGADIFNKGLTDNELKQIKDLGFKIPVMEKASIGRAEKGYKDNNISLYEARVFVIAKRAEELAKKLSTGDLKVELAKEAKVILGNYKKVEKDNLDKLAALVAHGKKLAPKEDEKTTHAAVQQINSSHNGLPEFDSERAKKDFLEEANATLSRFKREKHYNESQKIEMTIRGTMKYDYNEKTGVVTVTYNVDKGKSEPPENVYRGHFDDFLDELEEITLKYYSPTKPKEEKLSIPYFLQ